MNGATRAAERHIAPVIPANPYAADDFTDVALVIGPATGPTAIRAAMDAATVHPRIAVAYAVVKTRAEREALIGSVTALVRQTVQTTAHASF